MLAPTMLVDGRCYAEPLEPNAPCRDVRNPYTGECVGRVFEGGMADAEAAVAAATRAYPHWSRTNPQERARLLRKCSEAVEARAQELAGLLVAEIGKPIVWARGEVARLSLTFLLAAEIAERLSDEPADLSFDPRGAHYDGLFRRFPIGPVLCIVPYNWPYNLAAHKIAPALAAGNTVILKPSPLAPLSSFALAKLAHDAGCPHGVINCVNVAPGAAECMARDPRVAMVSFTGSPAVGWRIKSLVPEKRVILELGGDASAVVCPGADLDWAAQRIATSAYGYAGQVCISAQHALVHEDDYAEAREKLIAATLNCSTGDPSLEETVCGPLIHAQAADRVMEWTREALDHGASALTPLRRKGNVLWPALLENVPFSCRLGSEEVFGPVLTLRSFRALDEAIAFVNRSQYGIHASVFSPDPSVHRRCFEELEVGGVVANDYPTLRFDNMPYGGVKRSGFGREGVRFALEAMTETKTLVRRR